MSAIPGELGLLLVRETQKVLKRRDVTRLALHTGPPATAWSTHWKRGRGKPVRTRGDQGSMAGCMGGLETTGGKRACFRGPSPAASAIRFARQSYPHACLPHKTARLGTPPSHVIGGRTLGSCRVLYLIPLWRSAFPPSGFCLETVLAITEMLESSIS